MFAAAHVARVHDRIQAALPDGCTVTVAVEDGGEALSATVTDPRDPSRVVISTMWRYARKRDGSAFGRLQPTESSLAAICARFAAVAAARNI